MEREGPQANMAESGEPVVKSDGVSRREFLKMGGLFAGLLAEAPKDASALLTEMLEGKEGESGKGPKVSFEIFYGAHARANDAVGLDKRIAASDVYVPELAGWDEPSKTLYESISMGKVEPENYSPIYGDNSFKLSELKSLHNSKKPIFMADIPDGHKLYNQLGAAYEGMGNIDFDASLKRVIENYKKVVKRGCELQLERERVIIENLRKLRSEIKSGKFHGVDVSKKEIKVLVFLGAVHTKVYHALYASEDESRRSFPMMPFVYGNLSFGNEAIRRAYFGKDIPDELAARSILMNFSGGFIMKKPVFATLRGDTMKVGRLLTKIFSAFNIAEIQQIYETVQKFSNPMRQYPPYLDGLLEKKGIHLPQNVEELNDFFKNDPKPLRG